MVLTAVAGLGLTWLGFSTGWLMARYEGMEEEMRKAESGKRK